MYFLKAVTDFLFLASKITEDGDCSHEITRHLLIGRKAMYDKPKQHIKKRWQDYTEELYKKDLHDLDNHDGVITDLEPDILGCEVKWAFGSITLNKTHGGDGIKLSYFKS